MCQPGRPGPQPTSQVGSPGLVDFHSTKSRALSLSYSSESIAGAGLDAFVIEARQLAVGRQRRDLEVDRSVARVGMAALAERVDHVGHRLQVLIVGGARRVFDRLDAERQRVLAKRGDVLIGVLAQRQARLRRADDGLVVDVGEVHDVVHLVAGDVLQRAAQHVHADEGAEVADVPARVDRQAARVHADGVVERRGKVLLLPGQGVVETHGVRPGAAATPTRRRW